MEATILIKEQINGNNKLEIFEKRGTKAAMTDFAILTGGQISDKQVKSGCYWTKTPNGYGDAFFVNGYSTYDYCNKVTRGDFCARPVLPYSQVRNISLNKIELDGVNIVLYGEYPQQAVSKDLQTRLNKAYKDNLETTGKTYTVNAKRYYHTYIWEFEAQTIEEYTYEGKKYVRVKANSCYWGCYFTLSNGVKYKDGDYVWVEVLPIKWLIDEKNDIALAERLLFSGIQFKHKDNYKGDFTTTELYNFLNTYFIKEIIPSKIDSKTSFEERRVTNQKANQRVRKY